METNNRLQLNNEYMNYKDKRKLTSADKAKQEARYVMKLGEFKLMSLDELKELYTKGGISSTDRHAIVVATNYIMKEKMIELSKLKECKEEGINLEGE